MKLLEIYYNINYYCTYKLLFILCWRMLNPLYWLSLLKWDNRYIKWLVSIGKKTEEAGMDKGIYLVVFMICGYYINEIFLFKNDKYKKYFIKFEKEKKYLLYYGIYVVSLIVQLATFYLLLNSA